MSKYPSHHASKQKEIQLIHIARHQLGMDDDTYRDLLRNKFGKCSSLELDWKERRDLLDHFKCCGFKAKKRGQPHNLNKEPQLQKIEALLAEMQLPWSYADAIGKQMFGVERSAWLRKDNQMRAVIAALEVEKQKREMAGELMLFADNRGKTESDIDRISAEILNFKGDWRRSRTVMERLKTWIYLNCNE